MHMMKNLPRLAVLLGALISFAWFFTKVIPQSWSQPSTDFPNYYTAAVLARTNQPLRQYYDWPWFQRQMHRAGIENQLGGYIPQTPLTMAPFVPLSYFPAATARKIWLVLNLLFLAVSLILISRMTRFSLAH